MVPYPETQMSRRPLFFLLLLATQAAFGQNYAISTVVGSGPNLGDGNAATGARFGTVSAVMLAPDGSVYVADFGYGQVRRVAPNGTISLFAGGPVEGFGGDEGPATSALLSGPSALAMDPAGNIYIGETGNHR